MASKSSKTEWLQVARRGKAQPILAFDPFFDGYRYGYFKKAHTINWTIKNFRQFDSARWFGKEDFKNYTSMIVKAIENKNKISSYAKKYQKRINAYRGYAHRYLRTNFKKLSDKELTKIFSDWFEGAKLVWCFGYEYIVINSFLPDIITSQVAARVPDLKKQNDFLGILFEADEPSELRLEKKGLVNITKYTRQYQIKIDHPKIQQKLKNHCQKFAHLGFYYFRGSPYTIKNLKPRLNQYLAMLSADFKKVLADFKRQEENKELSKKIIKNLNLNKQTVHYIQVVKRWATLSSKVDETWAYVVYHLMPLWQEIAHRFKITYSQFYSLTGEEIISAIKKGKLSLTLKAEAKQRHKDHALILENGKKRILIGQKLKAYYKSQKQKQEKIKKVNQLKGLVASSGQAQGKIRLVFTVHDVAKVEPGDILVAEATNPTFVPAMERAKAIITDEGGLLSHAAIVSRELKIPCIVSTKIATKVLKDGDRVEVDTEKGLVKIL